MIDQFTPRRFLEVVFVRHERGDDSQAYRLFDTFAPEAYVPNVSLNFVSLHPCFKVRPGKLDAAKAALRSFD